MGLQKFKTFEEAQQALWCYNPDETYFKQVRELFKLANRLCPPDFPRGVFKYRTMEEANNAKQEWLLQNALKKRASRGLI
ncbi:MAG: hypothetical protein QG657_4317 [Acidobacteriota bacterium]|nr:hypothetical protein [Acidobacteriota bacterium]